VVERSPEKAGVGGSTPSLATIISISCALYPSPVCGQLRTSILRKTRYKLHTDRKQLQPVESVHRRRL